jgi:hypothetical protein
MKVVVDQQLNTDILNNSFHNDKEQTEYIRAQQHTMFLQDVT